MEKKVNNNENPNSSPSLNAQIPERCRVGFQQYTVVAGDTIEKIAKKFNVSVDFLIAENPHITDPNKIYPGDILCVPVQPKPGEGRIPESCPIGYVKYTVKSSDSIFKIAQSLGVSVDLIIANNLHIPDPKIIFPGDVLCVPVPLTFPSCSILKPTNQSNRNSFGTAIVQKLSNGKHVLAIVGIYLPDPASLGNFDGYDGFVGIPGIGGYGFSLINVIGLEGTWIRYITLDPLLSKGNQIYILPSNSQTGASGQPILSGLL